MLLMDAGMWLLVAFFGGYGIYGLFWVVEEMVVAWREADYWGVVLAALGAVLAASLVGVSVVMAVSLVWL